MQDITPQIPDNYNQLDSYGNGKFKVNGKYFENSIIIAPTFLEELEIKEISEIKSEHLKLILDNKEKIEFLIVGAGETSDFLGDEAEKTLKNEGIIIEYMTTGAAARTYNILLSEGRKFAAILIAV